MGTFNLHTLGEDEMDLRAIMATLWWRRWWIVCATLIFAGVAIAIALFMTPTYRSTTVLVPAGADSSGVSGSLGSALGSLGGLASLAGVSVATKGAQVEEALAVLRSRQFIETFIRDNQLLPLLFANKWDERSRKWRNDEQPTHATAHKFFVNKVLSLVQDNRTSLVVIQVDWSDRELAAKWANQLVAQLNAEMRTRAMQKTDASLQFLEKELTRTSMLGTQDAIGRLMEAQINQRMLANVTEEYAFRVVERATAADVNDPLRPNKPIIVVVGFIAGAVLGILGVLIATLFQRSEPNVRGGCVPIDSASTAGPSQ